MTFVGVILLLLAIVLALIGIIGAIVPALPGPPLSFAALLVAYFATGEISGTVLLLLFFLTVVVTALDYIAPIWFTKLGGGSKQAVWGSTLGLIAGLFFMPLGLIVGPLAGALLGELIHDSRDTQKAIKVAAWSFVSFLTTTGLKLVCSCILTYYTFVAYWNCIPPMNTWFQ